MSEYSIELCESPQGVPHDRLGIQFTDGITVEAWVDCHDARAERMQQIVGQWSPATHMTPDRFAAYDAGNTDGLETKGFFGAVFDGRYVYFVPQHDELTRHGRVLRYDTHGSFKDPASWAGYDAGSTDGLNTKGYYGAAFDGRYVYFVPRRDPQGFHTRVLRYDTSGGEFRNPTRWQAHDLGLDRSYQSAAFDGRYLYFVPGHVAVHRSQLKNPDQCDSPAVTGMDPNYVLQGNSLVLRYDTRSELKSPASWSSFNAADTGGLNTSDYDGACFDGRYIYLAPLSTGVPLRYDTQGRFDDPSSWRAFDAKPLGMKLNVGCVFDGRWIYYVMYGDSEHAIRYDTTGAFDDRANWQRHPLAEIQSLGNTRGFDGAVFDGRYVYFIPYYDGGTVLHGKVLRFDATSDFTNPEAWHAFDAGLTDGMRTVGFNGAAFDGRYIYHAAWIDRATFPMKLIGNGRILRQDTLDAARSSFSLRYADCGHNGGLCAALPGARFLVNTERRGVLSVSSNRPPQPGRHHIVGTYDGRRISLFIDGQLAASQPAHGGRICASNAPIAIGKMHDGLALFQGQLESVRMWDRALTEQDILKKFQEKRRN